MSVAPAFVDAIREARRLAEQGYGWHDIIVMVPFNLSEDTAKQIVREAEFKRLSKAQEAKP